jgi:hypothetical protein
VEVASGIPYESATGRTGTSKKAELSVEWWQERDDETDQLPPLNTQPLHELKEYSARRATMA